MIDLFISEYFLLRLYEYFIETNVFFVSSVQFAKVIQHNIT